MSIRNAIVLLLALSTLSLLVGCGSSSPAVLPPPSGGYSDSSFSGVYVFSFSGTDITDAENNFGSFFTAVGTLNANGRGAITSGSMDIVDASWAEEAGAESAVQTGIPVTGRYTVTADGRGSGTITVTAYGQTASLGIDFVLTTSSHGLITRFDENGTGSGTLDLQDGTLTQGSLGSYAFSLSGTDPDSNAFVAAGAFTLESNGTISTGIEDINDNKNPLTSLPLGGSVVLGSAGASGPATLTATGSPYGNTFDVWPIDATHLKFIEVDGVDYLEGDAFTQATSISAGQVVFTATGLDSSGDLLASGGFFSYDGSQLVTNGFEAINDGASSTLAQSSTVSGTMTATSGGRYALSLSGLYNGIAGGTGTYTFAAYPTASGVLFVETDASGVTAGTAFPQTATTLGTSQGYGLNLTGANGDGEVDDIAEFVTETGSTLSNGFIDENDEGFTAFKQQLGSGGTYTYTGTGYGSLDYPATNSTLIGTLNLGFFVANSSTVLFIDIDAGAQLGVGSLQAQGSDPTPALAHTNSHFAALRTVAALRARQKK